MRYLTGLLLCLVISSVHSQGFPSKPVKVAVPYAAGTGPDVFTRYLSERLSRIWGQQVVIENKTGASGFIAIEGLKNAVPDGHELLIAANGHTAMNPALYRKLPYDPEKDLVPIALTYRTPFFIAISIWRSSSQALRALMRSSSSPWRFASLSMAMGSSNFSPSSQATDGEVGESRRSTSCMSASN